MATVGEPKLSVRVVINTKEHRGVGLVRGVFIEEAVDRFEQTRQILACNGVLAAKVCLQVSHQQGSGHPFARDIRKNDPHHARPHVQKIVVVATDLACLKAASDILKCF